MNNPARIVACVLTLSLTGCWVHKNPKPTAPQVAPKIEPAAPALPPPTQQPPPEVLIPTKPPVSETELPVQNAKQPPKKKPATSTAPAETQQAAAEPPPTVSAIGQLSSGDPAGARYQTEASINDIERGLNGITRQLSEQEQATASHIREFIKSGREALKSGDVDGATTLMQKAKVLLQELTH
jgi:type IV secretory pathway VirB10-like protein